MQKIVISSQTIILAVLFFVGLWFLWIIRDLIFSLFVAFIIMSALKPIVIFLIKKKIPRLISASLVYIFFLGLFFYSMTLIIPPLVGESASLLKTLPVIIENISPSANLFNLDLNQHIPDITNQFLGLIGNIFSNTVFIISTLFFSFYFLIQEDGVEKILEKFLDAAKTKRIVHVMEKAEKRMSAWFWGELTLMSIVGILTFIGLSLIRIKYSLPLAVLAGFLEAVPNLGPTLAAVPAVLIGFSQSYFLGFAALALSFVVQQLENNLIVPIVMKKAVGLNPIITLIALIIGGKLAGLIGVILAIPVTLFLETVLIEMTKIKKSAVNLR